MPFRGEEGEILAYSYILQNQVLSRSEYSKWHEGQHKNNGRIRFLTLQSPKSDSRSNFPNSPLTALDLSHAR